MKNNKRKLSILTVCLLLTVFIAVGSTIAYIFTSTDPVTNTFTPVDQTIDIPEEMDGSVKENATVQNTGDVDSYLRAKIVATWQNAEGDVYPVVPELGVDYTMTNGANWVKIGDLYYYNKIAAPGQPAVTKVGEEIVFGDGVTADDMLIIRAEAIKAAPADGYTLHIEILGQAVQAEPSTAISETWGVDPSTFIA